MLTRQAPAILDGLRGVANDDQAAQLLQAFANCNTSMSHRGSMNLSNPQFPNRGGVMRPQANGGGVSGVSRAGPAGGPGQMLKGGVYVPDPTQRVAPWGLQAGVGSGMSYPNNLFYGGDYYGADSYGRDYGNGAPSSTYLGQIDTGGNYYDNSTYYGGGGYGDTYDIGGDTNNFTVTNRGGDYYAGDWNTTVNDNSVHIAGPTSNTYYYGGDTVTIQGDTIFEGDTIINNYYDEGGGGGGGGPRGQGGPPGNPGQVGPGGPGGRDGNPGVPGAPGLPGGGGGGGRPATKVFVSTLNVRKGSAVTEVVPVEITVVTSVDFESCSKTEKTIRVLGTVTNEPVVLDIREIPASITYLAPG
jgi:hypothetical protein